jgi:hypothetical protein
MCQSGLGQRGRIVLPPWDPRPRRYPQGHEVHHSIWAAGLPRRSDNWKTGEGEAVPSRSHSFLHILRQEE